MIHSEGKYLLYGLGVGEGTVVTVCQLIRRKSDLCARNSPACSEH